MVSFAGDSGESKGDYSDKNFVEAHRDKERLSRLIANIEITKKAMRDALDSVDGYIVANSMAVSNAITAHNKAVEAQYGEISEENMYQLIQCRALQYYAAMLSEAMLKKHGLID